MNDSIRHEETRPWNVGTRHNLPEEIRARLGDVYVIAWTTFDDDQWDGRIARATCWSAFGPFLVIPCLWPFLIACFPLPCFMRWELERSIRNTFWILTDRDVKILERGADYCADFCNSGDILQSIPLSKIKDCTLASPEGLCGKRVQSILPTMAIVTRRRYLPPNSHIPRWAGQEQKAVGYGLKGCDWFAAAVQRQCDPERAVRRTRPMAKGDSTATEISSSSSNDNIKNDSTPQPVNRPPPTLGTRQTLPEDVSRCYRDSNIIGWTTLDDQWKASIQRTFWILTDTEVKIILCGSENDFSFVRGHDFQSIQLTQITAIGVRKSVAVRGCFGERLETVPYIFIDTVDTIVSPDSDAAPKRHAAEGYGLAACDVFAAAIIRRIHRLHLRFSRRRKGKKYSYL
jgi:hypothetical protein